MGNSPEERLAGLLGSSLEGRLAEKAASFGGLLTRASAVRLLCQESGISTEERITLLQARAGLLPFSFSARVDRVFPVQRFPGGFAKSVRLHISDKSGNATLVLWNEQARLAEGGGLLAGDAIECTGAYLRAGEIAISRRGTATRVGNGQAAPAAKPKEGICSIAGIVEKAEGVREYADRRTGEKKRMLAFTISSGGESFRAVWWSPPADAPQLCAGARVALEGASFRSGELHLNGFSRVAAQGAAGKQGEFLGIAFEGEGVALLIGKEKFMLGGEDALALFCIRPVPKGVMARTLLTMKASALEGRQVSYLAQGGRLSSLLAED